MAIGREDYEERKERKIERFNDRAAAAAQESAAAAKRSHDLVSVIPFGQPIMVGHHSEKGHRALLGKAENTFRKSVELSEKSDYYETKAESAANNRAISGDNPEALKLYQEKLVKLEAKQERMKAVNKAFSKGDEALKVLGFTDEQIAKMKSDMPSYENKPYPTWALSNNSAEIRRVKQKIEALKKLDNMITLEKITFPGGELIENIEKNRVQFIFDGKPSEEIRSTLKSYGFRWAPSEGAWQRQRTSQAIWTAKRIVEGWK